MSWEHDLAKEFKKRNNRESAMWTPGEVLSPERFIDEATGEATYEGDTIVTCWNKQVILEPDRLMQIPKADGEPYFKGEQVALLGDPFRSCAGSQIMLILGLLEHVYTEDGAEEEEEDDAV